jgi:hypothetical protein
VKRTVLLVLGFLWALALAASLARKATQLPAIRTAAAPTEVRAEIESGDAPYHRFLLAVHAASTASRDILVLVRDPGRNDAFHFYRAVYVLYPVRVWYVPVGFAPPVGRTFAVGVDPGLAAVVRDRGITVAGFFETDNLNRGAVYSVAARKDSRLSFTLVPAPVLLPPAPGYGTSRPVFWLAGLAVLLAAGIAFNFAAGIARGTGPAVTLALGLAAGAGLTAWWMTVLSLAGFRWSLPVVLVPAALAFLGAGWTWWGRPAVPVAASEAGGRPALLAAAAPRPALGLTDRVGLALFGLAVVVAAVFSVIPLSAWSNWDAWAIWFLKAKVFRAALAVDLGFLKETAYAFSHHDYPPGLPAVQNYLMLWTGGMDARLLRCLSPVFLAALGGLIYGLVRELNDGEAAHAWAAAGAFLLVPFVLEQGYNGYADLALAVGMTACLLALLRALRGKGPAWAVGLYGGFAGLVKDEGFLWALMCLAVLAGATLLRRVKSFAGKEIDGEPSPVPRAMRFASPLVAVGVLLLVAGPWKATTRRLGLKPNDYVISPARMLENIPERAPMVAKGVIMETLGSGVSMAALAGADAPGPGLAGWFGNQGTKWLLVWYLALAGVAFGWRRLFRFPVAPVVAVIALQSSAYASVYLASIVNVPWHIVTSLDRLLLQLSPSVFAVACVILFPAAANGVRRPPDSGLADRQLPLPAVADSAGRRESDKVARVKG